MAPVPRETVKSLFAQLDALHSEIISREWKRFSRHEFLAALDRVLVHFTEIAHSFELLAHAVAEQPAGEKPPLAGIQSELAGVQELVKKNREMELKKKRSVAREVNVLEKEESPDLYVVLEQKILSFLLKARNRTEAVSLFFHKHSARSPHHEKAVASALLPLLEQKEKELQDARAKYGALRAKSFMGRLEESAAADQEQELNTMSRTLAPHLDRFSHTLSLDQKQREALDNQHAQLRHEFSLLSEQFSSFITQSLDLIALLKKERDYARSVVLETEHETAKLRAQYTSQLLGLEQEKEAVRERVQKLFSQKIVALNEEVKQARVNEAHFREQALDYQQALREVRERRKTSAGQKQGDSSSRTHSAQRKKGTN